MTSLAIIFRTAGAFCGIIAVLAGALALSESRFPFNSEGRYFDSVIVHHEQSVVAYAAIAMVSGILALASLWAARYAQRKRR